MVGHRSIWLAESDSISPQRRAQRAAGVSGSGGDEHPLEPGLTEDSGVGAAVERHSASETKVAAARLPLKRVGQAYHLLLQDLLDAGCDVGESLSLRMAQVDGIVRVSRWPEGVEDTRGERAGRGGVKFEMVEVEPKGPVRGETDELAH